MSSGTLKDVTAFPSSDSDRRVFLSIATVYANIKNNYIVCTGLLLLYITQLAGPL